MGRIETRVRKRTERLGWKLGGMQRRMRALADSPNTLVVFIALDTPGKESLLELQA